MIDVCNWQCVFFSRLVGLVVGSIFGVAVGYCIVRLIKWLVPE